MVSNPITSPADGVAWGDEIAAAIAAKADTTDVATALADHVTQTSFLEQGPSGRQLAHASSIAYQSGIAGTAVDVTGLSITFTVGSRPVLVRTYLPSVLATIAGTFVMAIIADGSGATQQTSIVAAAIANAMMQVTVEERITTPGTYTRKTALTRFGGTGTINNNFNPANVAVASRIEAVER